MSESVGSDLKTTGGGFVEFIRRILPQSYLVLVLLGIVIIGYFVTPNFLTIRNFSNVVSFSSIIAILELASSM